MRDRLITFLAIICLAAAVGIMSWRDMHPPQASKEAVVTPILISYRVGRDVTAEMLPDDNLPLNISVGEFDYTAQGKALWTAQGMTPLSIPQRQTNLEFTFRNLPKDPAETLSLMDEAFGTWKAQGNSINSFIIEYHAARPDLDAYKSLLSAVNGKYKSNYNITAAWDMAWPADAASAIAPTVTSFIVYPTSTALDSRTMEQLSSFHHPFWVQYPAGATPADADVITLKKADYAMGMIFPVRPGKPFPKQEHKVGLFPKF